MGYYTILGILLRS